LLFFYCLLLVYLHLGHEEAHQLTQEEDPPTASSTLAGDDPQWSAA
jgi:hypothetical protein